MIADQVAETLSSITAALSIQLNLGQSMMMNTTSVFVSFETASMGSLSNKLIQQVGNAQIRLPSTFDSAINYTASVSVRVSFFPFIFITILTLFSIVDDATTCISW
jgi:hypothetical protein